MGRQGRVISGVAVAVVAGAVTAAPALAREFEGKVISKNREAKVFKLRQDEGGGTFRIKVNSSTTYDRLAGFGAIHVGDTGIEVVSNKKRNGRWIASHVERSGGGGGGDDDKGGDDNGGGGSDD
jgi:hypothetical protein